MVTMPRRGILGGTFNPIHIGHLLVAEEARSALSLRDVLVVPAGEPWMREGEKIASKADRWAMVMLAVQYNRKFVPSRVDLDRPGSTYSVDTLAELTVRKTENNEEFTFIIGADSLLALPQWKEPMRLLSMCRIAAVTRPGFDVEAAMIALEQAIPGASMRIDVVQGLQIGISATDIRQRCHEGKSIKYRVPETVESYIMERGLYR